MSNKYKILEMLDLKIKNPKLFKELKIRKSSQGFSIIYPSSLKLERMIRFSDEKGEAYVGMRINSLDYGDRTVSDLQII